MIISIDDIRKKLEKDFDLGEAIRTNEVDLIFCGYKDYEEILNEHFYAFKDDKNIKLLIRSSDDIKQHVPTAKIIFPKCPKSPNGDRGIPILFENKNWYVYLGKSDKKKAKTIQYTDLIQDNKKIKKFLNTVAKEIGEEISEYSKCKESTDADRMEEIVSSIKNKYNVEEE